MILTLRVVVVDLFFKLLLYVKWRQSFVVGSDDTRRRLAVDELGLCCYPKVSEIQNQLLF